MGCFKKNKVKETVNSVSFFLRKITCNIKSVDDKKQALKKNVKNFVTKTKILTYNKM